MKRFLIFAIALTALLSCQKQNGGLELGTYTASTTHGVFNAELLSGGELICHFSGGEEKGGSWYVRDGGISLTGYFKTPDRKHELHFDYDIVGTIKNSSEFSVPAFWDYGEKEKKTYVSFSRRN